jgi:hypothetical protein
MTGRDLGPDRVGLLGGEELEGDRVARGGDGGEDVVSISAFAAGTAQRSDRERLETIGEKTDRAVVTGVEFHRQASGANRS